MNPIELVKKHPIITGVGVVAVVIIAVMLSGGGEEPVSSGYPMGPSDAEIAAGMQMQQLSAAGQAQAAELNAQREIAMAQIAGNQEMGKLEYQYRLAADASAKEIAFAQLSASEKEAAMAKELAMAQLSGQLALADKQLQAQLEQMQKESMLTKFLARMDLKGNKVLATTLRKQMQQQTKISLASIKSMIKITKINDDDSFWDKIFG